MSTLYIQNDIKSRFGMVPSSLFELGLPVEATAVFSFLLTCRPETDIRVALIEQRLGIGEKRRQTAMRALTAAGLITRVKTKTRSGRIVTDRLVVTTEPLLRREVERLDAQASDGPLEQVREKRPVKTVPAEKAAPVNQDDTPTEKASGKNRTRRHPVGGVAGGSNPRSGGKMPPKRRSLINTKLNKGKNQQNVGLQKVGAMLPSGRGSQVAEQITPFLLSQLEQGKSIVLQVDGTAQRIEADTAQAGALLATFGKVQ